jgi:hypothetical protein
VVIFSYQNRYLKEYVVSLEQALREFGGELPPTPVERLSDEEVLVILPCPTEKPCKPWERWAPPDPPVNPFEAELKRRGIPPPPLGFVIDEE